MQLEMVNKSTVSVDMGVPELNPQEIPFEAPEKATTYDLDVDSESYSIAAVSMGNPHAVLTVDNAEKAPVAELGEKIESHQRFPNRVNVGFMEIRDRSEIRLRVFERGVGETEACGSGACAAAVAALQQDLVDSPVTLQLNRGSLKIDWQGEGQPLIMTGPAATVFHGRIRI